MPHQFFGRLVAPVLLALVVAPVRGVEPLGDLTGPWQLFVDDYAIEQKAGLVRTYHPFQKYAGNPVIRADQPWEGTVIYMYGNVLPNETHTGYRMWYHSLPAGQGNRLLYAESTDGITWTKPVLGNVLYNGTTNNNIYWQRDSGDHIASIIHTPWDGPDRQYKLINFNSARGGFLGAFSPNGTDFQDEPTNPLVTGTGDVGNFVWDFHKDQYLGYVKLSSYVGGTKRRSVAITTSNDWTTWTPASLILKPDDIDDRWASGNFKTDFYGLCGFSYESMYIGFLWILRVTDYIDVCQDGPIFVEMVTSRDGVHWDREEGNRPAMLPLGAGTWDGGMIFTPQQPLVENGQIKLYYGGINGSHCASNWVGGIGLSTLRKDGFASLDAGSAGGSLTTRKLMNAGGELHVNYTAAGSGSLAVEVLDDAGQVVPGFSQADCVQLQGDAVDQVVRWGTATQLPVIAPIRLRFVIRSASIYSFRVAQPVTVLQPPTITQQPGVQRVAPGATATFSVVATGEGTLAYQWEKDGVALANGGHVNGTQTASLTVLAGPDDVASYRCRVTSTGGSTTSNAADLYIGYQLFNELLLPGNTTSSASNMSPDGRAVVGTSGTKAAIWTALQGVRELPLPGDATSSTGANVLVKPDSTLIVTVNAVTPTATKAMRWDGTVAGVGTYTELKPLYGPRYWTARGMGTDGNEVWIVGSAMTGGDGGGREAVMNWQSTKSTLLAALPGGGRDNSDLHCVSDNGYAAGQFQYNSYSPPTGGTRSSWLYTNRRISIAMNSLGGTVSSGVQSVAKCISRDGTVQGGWSYVTGGSIPQPVIWSDPVTPTVVPFIAGASLNAGEVHALNRDGTVAAGTMWNSADPLGTAQAFIWDAANGTRKLQDVLIAQGMNLSGWMLQDVTGMSADGAMLCGNGIHSGASRGWVFAFADASPMAPLIVRHPSAQAAGAGQSVTFEIEAMGQSPLQYRWTREGSQIAEDTHYAGAMTPILTVNGVTGILEGEYRCEVTNSLGQATSNSAMLTLITVKPDLDHDGDVDQVDYGMLQACFSGPTFPQTDPACARALLDADNDVDYFDVDIFLQCLGSPNVVATPGCDQ